MRRLQERNLLRIAALLGAILMAAPALGGMSQRGLQIKAAPAAGPPPLPAGPVRGAGFEAQRVTPTVTRLGYKSVVPEKTGITVVIDVHYGDTEDADVRKYEAKFSGTYVIKGPPKPLVPPKPTRKPKKPKKVTWHLFFPFPDTADTFPNAAVKVNGKDVKEAKYSPSGVEWDSTFEEEQEKTITVDYTAFGEDDFSYMLDHTTRSEQFAFKTEIKGVEGKPILPAARCLKPTTTLTATADGFLAEWNYDNIITTRDIIIELPRRTMQVGAFANWPGYAFVTVILFAGILVAGAYASNRDLNWVHVPVAVAGFFMFYPLLLHLARHMPIERAFATSWIAASVLVLAYLWRAAGLRFALGYGGFGIVVLLGLFSVAGLVTKGTGTLLTIGCLILVAFGMVIAPKLAMARPEEEPPTAPLPPPDGPWPPDDLAEEPWPGEEAEEGQPAADEPALVPQPEPEPEPEPERRFCAFCGEQLGQDYLFCFHCGKSAEITVECPECKTPICAYCGTEYTYCAHCGAELPRRAAPAPAE